MRSFAYFAGFLGVAVLWFCVFFVVVVVVVCFVWVFARVVVGFRCWCFFVGITIDFIYCARWFEFIGFFINFWVCFFFLHVLKLYVC